MIESAVPRRSAAVAWREMKKGKADRAAAPAAATDERRTSGAFQTLDASVDPLELLESLPCATIITSPAGQILAVNASFTAVTGYRSDEVVGQNPRILSSGRHGEAFYQRFYQALERHGRWQGEIWNRRKNGETYPEWLSVNVIRDSAGKAQYYLAAFVDISGAKSEQARLRYLAYHDPLTGLPNRALFQDRLGQVLARVRRHPSLFALLYVDLDNFKDINDETGHAIGDEVLQGFASRAERCVRADDTVARLGGDEFAVILERPAHPDRGRSDR